MPRKASPTVSRRKLIQGLGAGAAVGLAGCAGDDPDDDGTGDDGTGDDGTGDDGTGDDSGGGDLGERVPEPILIEYWSDQGGATAVKEAYSPVVQENLQEMLDTEVEYVPQEFTAQIDNTILNRRTFHIGSWWHTSTPDRLDPHEMTRRFGIDWAGGNGRANPAQYHDCEYTHYAVAQSVAPDDEVREAAVHRAHSIMSETVGTIPTIPRVFMSVANADRVTLNGVGEAGAHQTNPYWYINTEPVEGDGWVVHTLPTDIEITNFMAHDSSSVVAIWSHLFHSTLTEYDENYEIQPVLASDYYFENDGMTIGAELRDATFHDGTEITAEDVQFTFEHVWGNTGEFPHATEPPLDNIEIIDDKTVEFHMEEPFPALVTRSWPRWGILHSEHWIENGAQENPGEFHMENVIGSGPLEVVDFGIREFIDAVPHDGHPVHEAAGEVFFSVFRDQTSAVEAFLAEEVDVIHTLSPGGYERARDGIPNPEEVAAPGFLPNILYPQHDIPPTKFQPFRAAVGMALDRDLMSEVVFDEILDPLLYSTPLTPLHPFYPPEEELTQMAPDGSGDIQGARQILEDAGWGWDDDGNLRYPADADLSPVWTEDEGVPQPDDFDCLAGEGEFEPTRDVLEELREELGAD